MFTSAVLSGAKDLLSGHPGSASGLLTYKGTLLVKKTNVLDVTNVPASVIDNTFEFLGQGVTLELISSTAVEASINSGKTSKSSKVEAWFLSGGLLATDQVKYSVTFTVDSDFGVPGAFTIKNNHPNEFYLLSLTLELPGGRVVEFPCNSWVYNASKYATGRIFFSNELHLPSETPAGLLHARHNDLQALRGNGSGIRQAWDRIYDYDVYNDLGTPSDKRPTLGGSKELPYPRRCRTGRQVINDAEAGTLLVDKYYVPSDERFTPTKNSVFLADTLKAVNHSLIPGLASFIPFNETFHSFAEIKYLYDHGLDLSKILPNIETPFALINEFTNAPTNSSLLQFPVPQVYQHTEKGWMSDEEFGRQMLAGVNPMIIELLTVFPPKSALDPTKYGPQESAITAEHIESQLEGKSAQEALEQKKLFTLDYHDAYMPYLEKINAIANKFAYATRTILYLKSDGTLKPVAIELSTPTSRKVVVPPTTRDVDWIWELAKAHVATNDSGIHQLVSHWLRTHACVEPFILATSRQLSAMHPLNPFLKPHYKNTLTINSRARQSLINAGGIIERAFTPGPYCIEMSAVVYRSWRFDEQGLPGDMSRGMATPDASAKHGLKLAIEDYPYATDGLEIWAALKQWTTDYIDAVYKDDSAVVSDAELQAWWKEIITIGHQDMKEETWWVKLDGKSNLVEVLTTIIWVASAHHAAVNFGQYAYAGYMPNHPTATHKPIPEKDSPEYNSMLKNPEAWFAGAAVHAFAGRGVPGAARHQELDEQRAGAGGIRQICAQAYTLLVPSSDNGITGRGIPSSISI